MVLPRQLPELDSLDMGEVAAWAGMTVEDLEGALTKAKRYSRYKTSTVRRGIDLEEHARMAATMHHHPGFSFRTRPLRDHIHGVAGHLIGEYAEATAKDLETDPFYRLGDRKGKSGLERVYELELRGVKGRESVLVDARNRIRDTARTADEDRPAEAGLDLALTLDLSLQQLAEQLMRNKKGSVVAIEPHSGEVLAMLSAPGFDPDLLVGSGRGDYYKQLSADLDKPLFNRAIKATYRPGSIWKMVQGLIALDGGAIQPSSRFYCDRRIIGCHGPHRWDDLRYAVIHSCNPYFYKVMQRVVTSAEGETKFERAALGLDAWRERVTAFGFGSNLGGRLPGTSTGNIPSSSYYDGIYGKRRWDFGTIYSIAIGEGELLTTPLQMANLAAILANRGWYRTPSLHPQCRRRRQADGIGHSHGNRCGFHPLRAHHPGDAPGGGGPLGYGPQGPHRWHRPVRQDRNRARRTAQGPLGLHRFCAPGEPPDCPERLCGERRLRWTVGRPHCRFVGGAIPDRYRVVRAPAPPHPGSGPHRPLP